MRHTSMQLRQWNGDEFDVTVIRRINHGEPTIRTFVNVTISSLARFYELSGGYRTVYSTKETSDDDTDIS